MKPATLFLMAFGVISFSYTALYGQLSVYAGPDTILCDSDFMEYQMGDYVRIEGDYETISYSWSCEYPTSIGKLYASSYLNDTSISHPAFISGFDTLTFRLEVNDDRGNKATDSLTLVLSQFIMCLADCLGWISEGDSVKLGHCITGGIPPYEYKWDNDESLSDPFIADPWAKPDKTTSYSLTLTDSAGCIATSNCLVTVYPSSTEDLNALNSRIKVFPNPSDGNHLTIENPSQQEFEIRFYDIQGQLIHEKSVNKAQDSVDSNYFAAGVYLYHIVKDDKTVQSGKIVINR